MKTKETVCALGCDIGNGYGFVSYLTDVKQDPMAMLPAQYELSAGMPTAAYITPPEGSPIEVFSSEKGSAEKLIARKPENGMYAVKTRLRERYVTMKNMKQPVSVGSVYAAIARDLLILANEELANRSLPELYDIVLTFPASFSDDLELLNYMTQSIEKLKINGHSVKVVGRLPEPAAVAIDYLYYMQNVAPESIRLKEDHFTVLVYDLGHGTFDVALVTANDRVEAYQVIAKDGIPDVGGKDFDEILYQEICRLLKDKFDYVPANARDRESLRREAVRVKHELTDNHESYISPLIGNDRIEEIVITRSRFEELIQYKLVQTLELTQQMMNMYAGKRKIDAVVLSGGASRMPVVKQMLEKIADGIPVMLYRPSEAVSFGAARYAKGIWKEIRAGEKSGKKQPSSLSVSRNPVQKNKLDGRRSETGNDYRSSNRQLEQFTEYRYGIFQEVQGNLKGIVNFVLNQGVKLPAATEKFCLRSPSSRLQIKVYRSVGKQCKVNQALPDDCVSIRWFQFDVPENQECNVLFTVEEDYNITVQCTLPDGSTLYRSTADVIDSVQKQEENA